MRHLPKLLKLFRKARKTRARRFRELQLDYAEKRWETNRRLAQARSEMHAKRNAVRNARRKTKEA